MLLISILNNTKERLYSQKDFSSKLSIKEILKQQDLLNKEIDKAIKVLDKLDDRISDAQLQSLRLKNKYKVRGASRRRYSRANQEIDINSHARWDCRLRNRTRKE